MGQITPSYYLKYSLFLPGGGGGYYCGYIIYLRYYKCFIDCYFTWQAEIKSVPETDCLVYFVNYSLGNAVGKRTSLILGSSSILKRRTWAAKLYKRGEGLSP